jgi:hypothetical protein
MPFLGLVHVALIKLVTMTQDGYKYTSKSMNKGLFRPSDDHLSANPLLADDDGGIGRKIEGDFDVKLMKVLIKVVISRYISPSDEGFSKSM